MNHPFQPIKVPSLKALLIARFERLILSGQLTIGQLLPSERELADQLGVSRPVLHLGLEDLARKGLVSLKPRVGAVINDYRRQGSMALLESLLEYHEGALSPHLLDSILAFRRLIELETARLASLNRSEQDLLELEALLAQEKTIQEPLELAELDFRFHHQVALASGNAIYPLLLNSCKKLYVNLSSRFYALPGLAPGVHQRHAALLAALRRQDLEEASQVMHALLEHGELNLKQGASAEAGGDHGGKCAVP